MSTNDLALSLFWSLSLSSSLSITAKEMHKFNRIESSRSTICRLIVNPSPHSNASCNGIEVTPSAPCTLISTAPIPIYLNVGRRIIHVWNIIGIMKFSHYGTSSKLSSAKTIPFCSSDNCWAFNWLCTCKNSPYPTIVVTDISGVKIIIWSSNNFVVKNA